MSDRVRLDLAELGLENIQPLEALFTDGFPDVWRDFARSLYLTLWSLFHPEQSAAELASLAIALARGIAQDLGGSQPYIPVGSYFQADAKAVRVVEALKRGEQYRAVAEREAITESRVRQIQAAWRREQFARRQGELPLG